MKTHIKHLFIGFIIVFLCFTSCQDEITQIENPNEQETVVPNSTLANLMSRSTSNFGAADDILDGASCFSIELPVIIEVNDITISIESEADMEALEDALNDVSVEDDAIDFVFPITITFYDYSQTIIENEDEFQSFIDECVEDENDVIECVDFVYPISLSVFNSGFNLVDTVFITDDEALYTFLDELEDDDNGLIVSLNFPVTLAYTNGETIEVNSNEELATAIEAAEEFCINENECIEDEVILNLIDCPWVFSDGSGNFENDRMIFNANGELQISEGMATSAIGGYWSSSVTDNGITMSFLELTAFQDSLEGDWLTIECNVDRIVLTKEDQTLVLEQDCNGDLFNCFGDFELIACANQNDFAIFNLSAETIGLVDCTEPFVPSFHGTLMNAENNTSAIVNTEAYEATGSEVYLRIEANNGDFEIFSIFLNTMECNYFECFQSFDAILEVCDNGTDGPYEFNLPTAFANCTPSADVVTYHEILADAESAINPIYNPEVYSSTNVIQIVYVRVEINNQYEIFPIQLNIIDCNAGNCTEGEIDAILTECQWNVSSYNGSDNLIDYNFDFEQNSNIVVIYNDTVTIDAGWSISQTSDGVILEFLNVAGPNIQAINGSWLVVECTEQQLVLHNVNDNNNEIVLARTCE